MEEKNIDELLSEEIAAQIKALSDLQSGTKEKSTAIDDLTKLYKLRIEENKSVWDADEKYKDKLKELYGEEAHQKIVDAIAEEKAKDVYITSTGLVRNSSLDFDEHDPNDERLFYDAYSNRYFESSINRVIQAEYHLNRDFVISGYLPANHFYQLLGLEPLEGGDTVGWSIDTGIYWIDFNHSKVTLDDGLEVLVIDMDWVPDAGWDSE